MRRFHGIINPISGQAQQVEITRYTGFHANSGITTDLFKF